MRVCVYVYACVYTHNGLHACVRVRACERACVCVCVSSPTSLSPRLPFEPTALQIPVRVVQAVPAPGVKGERHHRRDKGEHNNIFRMILLFEKFTLIGCCKCELIFV